MAKSKIGNESIVITDENGSQFSEPKQSTQNDIDTIIPTQSLFNDEDAYGAIAAEQGVGYEDPQSVLSKEQIDKYNQQKQEQFAGMNEKEYDNVLFSPVRAIRRRKLEDGTYEYFFTPFDSLSAGQTYTGGSIDFQYTDSYFKKMLVNSQLLDNDFRKEYQALLNQHVSMPICNIIENRFSQLDEKSGMTQGQFIRKDVEMIRDGLSEAFLNYQNTRYSALKENGVDDEEARARALDALMTSIPAVAANHARLQAMLQGDADERKYAALALSEAWSEATTKYRLEIEEELRKLRPEELKKIGDSKREMALQSLHKDADTTEKMLSNHQNDLGLLFMASFCPPLFFLAILPVVCPTVKHMYNKHKAAEMLIESKRQYTIIDERAEIMAGIISSQSLMRDYIISGLEGKTEEYIDNFQLRKNIVNDERIIISRKLRPLYQKYFEKKITVGSPEHTEFMAELSATQKAVETEISIETAKKDEDYQKFKENREKNHIKVIENIGKAAEEDLKTNAHDDEKCKCTDRKQSYFKMLDAVTKSTNTEKDNVFNKAISLIDSDGVNGKGWFIHAYQGATLDDKNLRVKDKDDKSDTILLGDASSLSAEQTVLFAKDYLVRAFIDAQQELGETPKLQNKAQSCLFGEIDGKSKQYKLKLKNDDDDDDTKDSKVKNDDDTKDSKVFDISGESADIDMRLRCMVGYESAASKKNSEEPKVGLDFIVGSFGNKDLSDSYKGFWGQMAEEMRARGLTDEQIESIRKMTIEMSMIESYKAQIESIEKDGTGNSIGASLIKGYYLDVKNKLDNSKISDSDLSVFKDSCEAVKSRQREDRKKDIYEFTETYKGDINKKIDDIDEKINEKIKKLNEKIKNLDEIKNLDDEINILTKNIIKIKQEIEEIKCNIDNLQKEKNKYESYLEHYKMASKKTKERVLNENIASANSCGIYADRLKNKSYSIENEEERIGVRESVEREKNKRTMVFIKKYKSWLEGGQDFNKQELENAFKNEFRPLMIAANETCRIQPTAAIMRSVVDMQGLLSDKEQNERPKTRAYKTNKEEKDNIDNLFENFKDNDFGPSL